MTLDGDPPDFRLEDARATSEGGHEQNTEEQNKTTRRRNKVREKWKKKIINRLRTKQKSAQDKRNREWRKL